jgi:TolB-like protein/tetratricopeptide (TPR) repeat protein
VTDVFMSYARADSARVAPLVTALEAQGWSVWWDSAISPGQEFDRQIAAALNNSSAVLVVWTQNSVESRWVRGEARDGADRGVLIPVRFGYAPLPIDFRAIHTTDLDETADPTQSPKFQEVIHALGALITRRRGALSDSARPEPLAAPAVSSPGPARVAICVLPFANASADPEQQAFSDGITQDIITELSRWRLLAVRSQSASFKYRGAGMDVGQLARELNVRFVVEGSVRRIGDRVRINVQLIDATSGVQVWGDRFDRTQAEIFAVQDEVVQTIVSTLVGRVQMSDVERARRKPPSSLEAYECVLKGNALPWDDPEGAAEATRLFERAIEIDPAYGMAYGLLASMRLVAWRDDPGDSNTNLDDAYRLAMRAVALDDGESTCHSMLAQVCMSRRSYELALQHMRRAVEINPTNQWNQADMAVVMLYAGQAEEALTWIARARQIDPYFDPPWYWRQAARAYMVLGRHRDALSAFAHIPMRTSRDFAFIAACHAQLGEVENARACVASCLALRPDFSIQQLMSKEPFKLAADASQLSRALHAAGLPD